MEEEEGDYTKNTLEAEEGTESVTLEPYPSILPVIFWKSKDRRSEFLRNTFKLFVGIFYCLITFYCASLSSAYCALNLPNWEKYKHGMPDFLLDSIVENREAMVIDEKFSEVATYSFLLLLFVHKFGQTIFLRCATVMGTCYILRIISMLVTRLPVPNPEFAKKYCYTLPNENVSELLWRALIYMVKAGHSLMLIVIVLFLIKYLPNRWYFILYKIVLSVGCVVAISTIVVAKIHYTIDVFIAIVIAVLYFQYCHLHYRYNKRDEDISIVERPIIPLFHFFEPNRIHFKNELEWPWEKIPVTIILSRTKKD